jgi:hypothetical protein
MLRGLPSFWIWLLYFAQIASALLAYSLFESRPPPPPPQPAASNERTASDTATRGTAATVSACEREDFGLLGEAVLAVLGEEQPVVELDVEDSALAADELGVEPGLPLQRGRETRGLLLVSSADAVGDAHARHGRQVTRAFRSS